jgi:hypothetical protein
MHRTMTEWAFQIMRLCEAEPFLDPGIRLALFIVTLELISWHLDRSHRSCILA